MLVHGGGVTRSEGGFFDRLVARLAEHGIVSLRFDLRGHGESEGRQEELTLSGLVNDVRTAVKYLQAEAESGPVHLYGTSFGGGISAHLAARHPDQVRSPKDAPRARRAVPGTGAAAGAGRARPGQALLVIRTGRAGSRRRAAG